MSRQIDWAKRNELINTLVENFPDIATSGIVSFNQIMQVTDVCPIWIREHTVSRGVYNITTYLPKLNNNAAIETESMPNTNVVENVIPMKSHMPRDNPKDTPKVAYNSFIRDNYIPESDPNFVPFGIYRDLDLVLRAKTFYPIYVTGPSGNGKSASIIEICARRKLPLIRVNINNMSDEEQLIGTKTLKDGNIEIVEGPVLTAMKNNCVLLLEELDFSSPAILALQGILEGKPYYFKLNNEMVYPTPNFTIVATGNTKGKGSEDGRYLGTNILNEAFLERFAITFEQDYPTNAVEYKIVTNIMNQYHCFDEEYAKTIVKWAEAIRITFNDGGVDENMSTRRIVHIIRAFSIFKNKKKAIELCCNRFDVNTKLAFIDLYDKLDGSPDTDVASIITPTVDIEENYNFD